MVDQAEEIVAKHLFGADSGAVESVPKLPDFRSALESADETTVAADLGTSTQAVSDIVNQACSDLETGGSDPLSLIRSTFPNADLADMRGMNGLVRLVVDACPSVGGSQIGEFNGAVIGYLIENTGQQDTTPPILLGPSVSAGSAVGTALVSWFALDSGGLSHCSLWFRRPGEEWKQVSLQSCGTVSGDTYTVNLNDLSAGTEYQFAVAEEDTAGNWSQYGYSTWYPAR